MEKTKRTTEGNVARVVLFGPESTGKSTLSRLLADSYKTVYVLEYLRYFAQDKYEKGLNLVFEDNLKIVEGQLRLEAEARKHADKVLFSDTDVLQSIVYSIEYYGKVQNSLIDLANSNSDMDLYLLLSADIPWEKDVLRDKPNDRERLFGVFEATLKKYNKNYVVISGLGDERLKNAKKYINQFILG